MAENTHDKEMEALKANIASLREELSGLVAGLKNHAGAKTAAENDAGAGPDATGRKDPDDSSHGNDLWSELLRTFDTSRAQGERVVKNLAAEIDHHPLASIMAAFGLGYIIAKLWHEGDKR